MVCIYCRQNDTKVTNSRHQHRKNNIWRRRFCKLCDSSFTTIEKADLAKGFRVRKNTTTLEPFLKEKLFLSIYKCCKHRKAAISDASALTDTVLAALYFPANESFNPKNIANTTFEVLWRFDEVAATLYKAYYLQPATS